MTAKPIKNILFITSDEMRSDVQGFSGNKDCKTPQLDKLAERGTVFDKHYAPFPKCVPSRTSMHTGRYTHTDGVRTVMADNHVIKGTPTLGPFFRDKGYETCMFGLNHVYESDWFYGEGDQKNEKGAGVFDYHSFTKGPIGELACKERIYPEGTPRTGPHVDAIKNSNLNGLVSGSHEKFCDENRTDQAILFLEELRDPNKPFFLQLNLSKPHPPYGIHDPWYSMYDPQGVDPFPYDLPNNPSLPLKAMREHRMGNDVSHDSCREMQAVYYGMVSYIDDLVGQVVDCVDRLGLADETLIVFTSDHGDFAGQHGINEKWDAALQDSLVNVPFIVAGPGIPSGKRMDSFSNHVDLPATFLDVLGLEPPMEWNWHGQSLLPVLNGAPGQTVAFADGGHDHWMRKRFNGPASKGLLNSREEDNGGKQWTYQQCPDAMSRCKMVRKDQWKLVVREIGGNELFDVEADPFEMNNLYDEAQYKDVIFDLQKELLNWCILTDTDRPVLNVFGA